MKPHSIPCDGQRDIALAEGLAQVAIAIALARWPEAGIADDPSAWLLSPRTRHPKFPSQNPPAVVIEQKFLRLDSGGELMDVEEIDGWFRSYSTDVKTFLVYFLRRTDVDDLVQETFIRAMRGQKNYKRTASPKTWLLAIARNLAVDLMRAESRQHPMVDITSLESDIPTPEDVVLLGDKLQTVATLLTTLSEKQRAVVLLRTLLGMSVLETADVLGWTKTRVSVTYHRSLKILKHRLNMSEWGQLDEVKHA